jgi:hypothetical protein
LGVYTQIISTNLTILTSATTAADTTACKQDSVRVITGCKLLKLSITGTVPDSLSLIMFYERITYKFAASTDLPGRIGLWREVSGVAAEELITPFDSSARFAYLIGGSTTATLTLRTTTPIAAAALDSIRGVELRLYAASENQAQGTSAYQVFPLKTRIRFANKEN